MKTETTGGTSNWPQTDWSGVQRAARGVGKDAETLNRLILRYRVPLRAYLLSAFPSAQPRADEMLQDFAQDRILREGWLEKADPNRGRFRDLLKRSLKNFVRDQFRREARLPASLEELEIDPPAEEQGSAAFDLSWARALMAEALARMEADCRMPGKDQPRRTHIWDVFHLRMLQPLLEDQEPIGYLELVQRYGFASPSEAHNLLGTAKRIFSRHLESVIQEYETGGKAVKSELADLKAFLSGLSSKRGK